MHTHVSPNGSYADTVTFTIPSVTGQTPFTRLGSWILWANAKLVVTTLGKSALSHTVSLMLHLVMAPNSNQRHLSSVWTSNHRLELEFKQACSRLWSPLIPDRCAKNYVPTRHSTSSCVKSKKGSFSKNATQQTPARSAETLGRFPEPIRVAFTGERKLKPIRERGPKLQQP